MIFFISGLLNYFLHFQCFEQVISFHWHFKNDAIIAKHKKVLNN
jgi:hypothetical protein